MSHPFRVGARSPRRRGQGDTVGIDLTRQNPEPPQVVSRRQSGDRRSEHTFLNTSGFQPFPGSWRERDRGFESGFLHQGVMNKSSQAANLPQAANRLAAVIDRRNGLTTLNPAGRRRDARGRRRRDHRRALLAPNRQTSRSSDAAPAKSREWTPRCPHRRCTASQGFWRFR